MIKLTQKGILHVVTVLVVVPAAGFISTWVPAHFPGLPHFTTTQLTAYGVVGAGAAVAAALHYLERLSWFNKIVTVTDAAGNVTVHQLPNANIIHITSPALNAPAAPPQVQAQIAPPPPQPAAPVPGVTGQ